MLPTENFLWDCLFINLTSYVAVVEIRQVHLPVGRLQQLKYIAGPCVCLLLDLYTWMMLLLLLVCLLD